MYNLRSFLHSVRSLLAFETYNHNILQKHQICDFYEHKKKLKRKRINETMNRSFWWAECLIIKSTPPLCCYIVALKLFSIISNEMKIIIYIDVKCLPSHKWLKVLFCLRLNLSLLTEKAISFIQFITIINKLPIRIRIQRILFLRDVLFRDFIQFYQIFCTRFFAFFYAKFF